NRVVNHEGRNQSTREGRRESRPGSERKPRRNHGSENEPPKSLYCRIRDAFHVFARKSSDVLGSPWAFTIALAIIVGWAVTGPMFGFSDTWQLIINTGTTIVTFLMVFLIQNTQNRDAKAVHLKLDELIRAVKGARNRLVDLEKLSDDEMKQLEQEFERIQKRARHAAAAVHDIASKAED
ncbi:MAG TPA: low affinity iron permease family protein, partial [Chthoniobacterales bacterium]|nr:low affinity iron permease family protein [Chthoniobacterales bacterium]